MNFLVDKYPLQDESYQTIDISMEIHNILGNGMLEIVYKDALEYEFKKNNILYEREKKFEINYKEIILPHYFYADFVVFNNIILEVKAQRSIIDEHYKIVLNYLSISKCKLGLIINFGDNSLITKRLIN